MTDSTLNSFLARGTNAQRVAFTPSPPSPASGPSPTYIWHETDTGDTYAYNGTSWDKVNTSSGGATASPIGMMALDGIDGEEGMPVPGAPGAAGSGGASFTYLSVPNFAANNGTALGASNFGCRGMLFPEACTIYGVSFYATAASGSTTMTPGIYSTGAGGIIGSLLASGSAVSGVTVGLNNAPLTTPLVVAAGTYLWVGVQPLVANPTLGTVSSSTEAAFFGAAGALPATAPAATYGTLTAAAMFPRIVP